MGEYDYGQNYEEVKENSNRAKDKVKGAGEVTQKKMASSSGDSGVYEQGAAGTETAIKDDPLTEYREKEPMTPAKIKEHEPTAVRREMTEKIVEPGQTEGTNSEEAKEIARSKGMAKGTVGAAETGSKSEQGAAGSNK
jgi:hypothetical protein